VITIIAKFEDLLLIIEVIANKASYKPALVAARFSQLS